MKSGCEAIVRAEAITRFMDALAGHDWNTYEHSIRVSRMARAAGRLAGFRGGRLFELELGALLHDVGKLEVPPDLIRKSGPLTSEEQAVVRRHAYRGYELVRSIPGLPQAAAIVRSSHEWFDGSGYPHGLRGQMIPAGARLVAVVDAYDAMTQRDTYAPIRTGEEALAELAAHAGTQFDPAAVPLLRMVLTFQRMALELPGFTDPRPALIA